MLDLVVLENISHCSQRWDAIHHFIYLGNKILVSVAHWANSWRLMLLLGTGGGRGGGMAGGRKASQQIIAAPGYSQQIYSSKKFLTAECGRAGTEFIKTLFKRGRKKKMLRKTCSIPWTPRRNIEPLLSPDLPTKGEILNTFQVSPKVFGAKSASLNASGDGVLQLGDDFLVLDSAVLKPDGDLPLWEVRGHRDPSPLVLVNKFIQGVFALQFLKLQLCVRHSFLSPTPVDAHVWLV